MHTAPHRCRSRMQLPSSPYIWYGLGRRQKSISEEAKEIAWKTTPAA
jgi:hypothetical protein